MFALILSIVTCLLIILSVLLFPKTKIGKLEFQNYWIIALIGAITIIASGCIDIKTAWEGITSSSSINPLKILCLFISMTILSIFLDEIGFFKHMASIAIKKAHNKQIYLFFYLYFIIAILTIFTSNDIIILTFTPFICYFAKNAKINPLPYLISEFIAANTWSILFIIGNPTNIYIATTFNIGFFEYLKVMWLPTVLAGITSLCLLLIIFRKTLRIEMTLCECEEIHENKFLLIVGLVHLGLCTILLAVSSYIGLEMWYITLSFAISLLVTVSIYKLVKHEYDDEVLATLKRAPWVLIPFLLSMFVLVLSLKTNNITQILSSWLSNSQDIEIINYGLSSFISANIINNIPMSVLFTEIIQSMNNISYGAIYASIIGSNIGAFLTPIGALAGIMWMTLLRKYKIKFKFIDFMKYGVIIGVPTILIAIIGLYLQLNY